MKKRFEVVSNWDMGIETEERHWLIYDRISKDTSAETYRTKREATVVCKELNLAHRVGDEKRISEYEFMNG